MFRVAMRAGSGTGTTGLNHLLFDHPSLRSRQVLGSTAITLATSVRWIMLKLEQATTAIEVNNV